MLSFLFGGSRIAVQGYLDRVAFLMRFLEQHGLKDMHLVTASLRQDLLLNIPADERHAQERNWSDPSNRDIAISFSVRKDGRVKQFMLTGFGALANTLVIGTATEDANGQLSFTWSTCPESESRPLPRISRAFQKAFWALPGYTKIGFGQYEFLVRE